MHLGVMVPDVVEARGAFSRCITGLVITGSNPDWMLVDLDKLLPAFVLSRRISERTSELTFVIVAGVTLFAANYKQPLKPNRSLVRWVDVTCN